MKRQDRTENTHSTNNRVQFGSGQAQSSSNQALLVGVQAQPASDWVIQMLINKIKRIVEKKPINPLDEEEERKSMEDAMEPIRRFEQINEKIKKSYNEQVAKKQREKNMLEDMHKTMLEAKLNT